MTGNGQSSAARSPGAARGPVIVVTPFYNTDRFLSECIESVLRQTWTDFTYLLVDNHSTDHSLEIARRYEQQDSRVRVIRTAQHLPQRENYNFALSQAPRDAAYCKLVCADDWLYPECLERMIAVADSDPQIALVGSYHLRGTTLAGAGLPCDRSVFTGGEICRRQLLDGSFFFGSPTTLLYAGDLLRERCPFYDVDALHEDTELCYDVLARRKFGFVHQVLSYVRVDETSISGTVRDLNPQGLDKLIVLVKFGKHYLDGPELRAALRAHERRYYRAYVRAMFGRNRRRFASYHREGHRRVDYRLRPGALCNAALREVADLALNPLNALTRLRSLGRRGSRPRRHSP